MSTRLFKKELHLNIPCDEVFAWHARPGAIERLSPPWDPLEVIRRSGGIEKGAFVNLRMKAGPVPYNWMARHTDYDEHRLFRDEQISGPFRKWVHTHRFQPTGSAGCLLADEIEFDLPLAPLGSWIGGRFVMDTLERIFTYRHRITCDDLYQHHVYREKPRLNILISGASGAIGSALTPFLTTGGHRVFKLVRRTPHAHRDEIFWDPEKQILDKSALAGIDAVIHLAGDNIGEGRWTAAKKRRIIDSRVNGTSLIADAIAGLDRKPAVMICASAIGFYGDRGDRVLTESDPAGGDFISEVCHKWEHAAQPAIDAGIRTAFFRIGVVLSPIGGALERLLLPFYLGLGSRIASGRQYLSWVTADDVLGALYYTLMNDTIAGPVNCTAPEPVTNAVFTETFARILSRPALFSLPPFVIKSAFGQQGEEILLSSTRVVPEKLLQNGYTFRFKELDGALAHVLGRRVRYKT